MMEKVDADAAHRPTLSSQYISSVEVGGTYAHLFFRLLNFLELPALVITDIDSIRGTHEQACKVSEGTGTSNACIRKWFNSGREIRPEALSAKADAEKINKGIRLAYQVPEKANVPCGRSFEQSFILANPTMFGLDTTASHDTEEKAWAAAEKISKKSDFALKYGINETNWITPRYIAEGLRWLRDEARWPAVADTTADDTAAEKAKAPAAQPEAAE